MAKQKYSSENAVRQKINQLFEFRKLDELLHLGNLDKQKKFIEQLVHLQTQIYMLDAYLEGQWALDKAELKKYWSGIQQALIDLGYDESTHEKWLKSIRRYEKIERNCRKDEWPTKVSLKKFYSTKSCDVQLIRRIIYDAAPALKDIWKEKGWIYYDVITEMNDDISDVEEDVNTYNGNRFLISLLRRGTKKTQADYKDFIEKSLCKADTYFEKHPRQEQDRQLHDWITRRTKETLVLLDESIKSIRMDHISKALLLQHMK